ncbi:MAG: PAS domain S-box protein [Methanobacteriaceae archaeon]|nr:PAS domain S-box protein [Methanobacteriaceae archaeon]
MHRGKILVVEDDAIEAMDLKRTLESFGYEVPYVASRGDDAVEKAAEVMPDLILMDIVLKGEINGIEAAFKIKNLNIPLIFLTAHSEDATVQKAKLTEPYGYIIKPFDSSELRYSIELALYKNKMEKNLKVRERLLNSIINDSPILQFVIDKNHHVLYWNEALASYSGISAEEIVGTDEHWRAFYSEKRPCLADLMVEEDFISIDKWYGGKYQESEHLKNAFEVEDFFPSLGKNGKWLHFTAATIKDDSGEVIGALETLEDITERKNAEKTVKDQYNFLQNLIDTIPYPVFYKDTNYKYIGCNKAFEDFIGFRKEEIIGKTVYEVAPKELADKYHKKDKELFDNPSSQSYEAPVQYADGSKHIVLFNKSTFNDDQGQIAGLIGLMVDITEQKKAEKQLLESEEKFREIFNNANDAFYLLKVTDKGANEKFAEVNEVASQMLGYLVDELLKMSPNDIDASDSSRMFDNWQKLLNKGTAIFETVHKTKNGKEIPVEINGRLFDIKGEKTLFAIARDISERKLAEKALENSEAEYKAIFENIKSAVAVYESVNNGSDFIFKDFNQAAEEIEQIKKESVLGKRVTEVFPGIKEYGLFEVFQRVWKTGIPEKHPVSMYKDERIEGWRENYVYKLPSGDLVAVYDDLTEIKQYEEELEKNQLRLRSLVRILQYEAESVQDFLDYALEEAIKLTESKIGYIYHYYEDREEFILNTWSEGVMDECSIKEAPSVYKLSQTGVWGEAVRQRKPIILNDFEAPHPLKKGYPEGHAPLHKFMTIPVFSGDKIVAVVGVANKKTDYTETDVLQLELLMESIWKVLDSQKAEEALKESEARYRAIFENTGTATAISEENMILSLVNEEFAKLTGFSKDEIQNKMQWTDFFVEEELSRMKEYHKIRRTDPGSVPRNYESVLKDRWGNTKDVYMSVAMLPGTRKSLVSVLDITEKKQSNRKLKRELKINQALAEIYAPLISPLTNIQDISIVILKQALSISGSEHGFVATIDPKNQDLVNQTLTRMMPQCEVYKDGKIPEEIRFPIGPDGLYSGLWGHCLNTKEGFYTNDASHHTSAKGVPKGHVKIEKFLAVPVLINDELVGEIALANPPEKDYSRHDLRALKRIAEFFALAIQRKRYEEQINKSLDEKDLLIREIHHRVKNNMQIISSILNLQSFAVSDPQLLDILKQNQNRIKSMAMIHEKLYQSHNLVKIDFGDYLRSLTADIYYTYSITAEGFEMDLDFEPNIFLNIETSIPCGLIYSELLSNCIKHAYPEGGKGKISAEFKRVGEDLMLRVSDDGVGLPDEIDFRHTQSLGLQLVTSLVKQLDGTIELDKSQGTSFTVKFHELKYKERI